MALFKHPDNERPTQLQDCNGAMNIQIPACSKIGTPHNQSFSWDKCLLETSCKHSTEETRLNLATRNSKPPSSNPRPTASATVAVNNNNSNKTPQTAAAHTSKT